MEIDIKGKKFSIAAPGNVRIRFDVTRAASAPSVTGVAFRRVAGRPTTLAPDKYTRTSTKLSSAAGASGDAYECTVGFALKDLGAPRWRVRIVEVTCSDGSAIDESVEFLVIPALQAKVASALFAIMIASVAACAFVLRPIDDTIWDWLTQAAHALVALGLTTTLLAIANRFGLPQAGFRHLALRAALGALVMPLSLLFLPRLFIVRVRNLTDNKLTIDMGWHVVKLDPDWNNVVVAPSEASLQTLLTGMHGDELQAGVEYCFRWGEAGFDGPPLRRCRPDPPPPLGSSYRQLGFDCAGRKVHIAREALVDTKDCAGDPCDFEVLGSKCQVLTDPSVQRLKASWLYREGLDALDSVVSTTAGGSRPSSRRGAATG